MKMLRERARHCSLSTVHGPVEVAFRVQRRRGMRHLRVVVDESNQIVLKVPFGMAEHRAVEFLRSQGDWIVKVMRSAPPALTLPEYLHENPHLSALGGSLAFATRVGRAGGHCSWDREAGTCLITVNPTHAEEPQIVKGLRSLAKEVIPARVQSLARRYNLRVGRITIRDQRTRWGSCSAHRSISLNWRLVLLPAALHDYIILHELAHLTHLNHSRRFWDLLAFYDPDSQRHDKEITFHSRLIMRMGRHLGAPKEPLSAGQCA